MIFAGLTSSTSESLGQSIVPSDRVSVGVNIRAQPVSNSQILGLLRPGEGLPYVGSVPRWHEVLLPGGGRGFVSKSWTELVDAVEGEVTVDVADVGTGLAVLIRGPDFALIYDGGSNDDLARGEENRFLAFLRAEHPDLQMVNHLVVSHAHRDHVELLPDLVTELEVEHVWDSGIVYDNCGYRALLRAVSAEPEGIYHSARENFGIHTASFGPKHCYGTSLAAEDIELQHGSRIDNAPIPLGAGSSMTFLHVAGEEHGNINENSLVARIDIGDTRILLMGDAEAGGRQPPSTAPASGSTEGILLACCSEDLAADVLVVGHHGSKTSSRTTFLDAVGAEVFIVSSGPMKYGSVILPDAEVIVELAGRGTVFRTDFDDPACEQNPAKIGTDADGESGGCDNVRILIRPGNPLEATYLRRAD